MRGNHMAPIIFTHVSSSFLFPVISPGSAVLVPLPHFMYIQERVFLGCQEGDNQFRKARRFLRGSHDSVCGFRCARW